MTHAKKGYWIAMVDVTDPEATIQRYIAANKAAFDKYGARFLVRGGRGEVVEGPAAQPACRHRVRLLPDGARLLPFAGIPGRAEAPAGLLRPAHFAIVEGRLKRDPLPRHRPQGRPVRAPEARRHGDQATVYNEDPGGAGESLRGPGFCLAARRRPQRRLRRRERQRRGGRARSCEATKNPVQLGGGIRTLAQIEDWLDRGLARVILGTVAVRDPDLVQEACRLFPGKIAVGIDARGGKVAVEGWAEASSARRHRTGAALRGRRRRRHHLHRHRPRRRAGRHQLGSDHRAGRRRLHPGHRLGRAGLARRHPRA